MWGYKTYANHMMYNFNNTFGYEPSNQHYSIPPNYKPDISITYFFNYSEKAHYWQFICEMQWAVALCCIDIMYSTIYLSWYRPDPRKVCLAKIQHIYGYLNKYTSTFINCNTKIPTYDNFKMIEEKWGNLYAGEPEDLTY